ncbi:hypothetical protein ACFLUO_07960 [Chloroflexota bacterium]
MNSTLEIFTEIIRDVSTFFDNFWMFLYEWGLPFITAIGGAVLTLVARELLDWYKRPKLEINFEEREGVKHHIADVNDFIKAAIGGSGEVYRIKYLRFKVNNKGRRAAFNCEAKLEITSTDRHPAYSDSKILHWARRHDLLHTTGLDISNPIQDIEKIYSPVNLNRNDFELLEVLKMHYHYSGNKGIPPDLRSQLTSASVEAIALTFTQDVEYTLKVSVYSHNANPASKSFRIKWDGTVVGFNSQIVLSKETNT